jgi:hypothetical protein
MLLKDSEGDVGICFANWIGFRQGRPGNKGTVLSGADAIKISGLLNPKKLGNFKN